ncbi:hypothetical protein DFH08DRAFT_808563 [Mycena albidolilacea]|uniref:Uncharacterized protein n=1 Tax=Mycena albidolilacea TaxID=1033008 RepID=A0AAD7A2K5_9AGAR|nr:hypothetical protein DFH08DRAFT_808563 [Mycena albidolilacea]
MNGVGVGTNTEDNKGENSRSRDKRALRSDASLSRSDVGVCTHTHYTEGQPRKATSWITRGRVLTARAGRAGTREKREPVVKVVRRSSSSGGPTLRRLSKGCATQMKWPSLCRGGAEGALEDGKHVLELSGRSTKVRTIWNIIIEKLKTAGAETCPTHGGPGGMTVPAAPNVGALWWCTRQFKEPARESIQSPPWPGSYPPHITGWKTRDIDKALATGNPRFGASLSDIQSDKPDNLGEAWYKLKKIRHVFGGEFLHHFNSDCFGAN